MSTEKPNPKSKKSAKNEESKVQPQVADKQTITRLSQSDVPSCGLDKALSIATAIFDHYGGKSATPFQVAKALNVLPSTGPFRMLCGASIAYGLTKGGYNASEITIEPLARRIIKPTTENDDLAARVEAFLKPKVIKDFFNKYNGSPIPREDIAKNVLEEFGVPQDRLGTVLDFIIKEGEALSIIVNLKAKKYVELNNDLTAKNGVRKENNIETTDNDDFLEDEEETISVSAKKNEEFLNLEIKNDKLKKVFITHGKNTKFIDPIKKLLSFGELVPIVSVEKTTISLPVPDKVLNDMRSCGAAIIHVEDEMKLVDDKADEHVIINSNVLIEIGAAMALFGRRFILLVKEGIKLPSNLQGLFEVRYSGEELNGDATIKLLEAINDIKNQNLPN